MLLAIVLLYVGAVLCVNGLWLVGGAGRESGATGGRAGSALKIAIQGREVAAVNLFTGFVGVAVSLVLIVDAADTGSLPSARSAAYILLFACTYLWVAYDQYFDAGTHALGWYCFFVAVTAVVAGVFQLQAADGAAGVWLGLNWLAWAVLWLLYWMLLALERPIGRLAGYVSIVEGTATAWIFAIVLLEGKLTL